MLDRLPIELLRLILDLTVPPEHAYSAYDERVQFLAKLSLVNKAFRGVAQPMLWRTFRPVKGMLEALRESKEAAKLIRVFQVKGKDKPNFASVFKALALLSNVEEVSMALYWERLTKPTLTAFSTLRTLTLSELTISGGAGVTYPHLTSLSLHSTFLPRDLSAKLFSKSTLPKVTDIAITDLADRKTGPYFPVLSALFSQLSLLQVRAEDSTILPSTLFQQTFPILLSYALSTSRPIPNLVPSQVLHVQLGALSALNHLPRPNGFDWQKWVVQSNLSSFKALLKDIPTLQTLFLPAQLHPDFPLPAHVAEWRSELHTLCVLRDVRIIWRFEAKEPEDDLGISREFREFARQKRSLEQGGQ
ncbi:hypothetical protein JCM10213_005130 [Rhodosporidiobolus nylandii]